VGWDNTRKKHNYTKRRPAPGAGQLEAGKINTKKVVDKLYPNI
tara:strand:+ start:653 stop:781 length:129 start_codon:yes stop_codon:yes gene_type:complete